MIWLGRRACVKFSLNLVPLYETGKANKMCLNEAYGRVYLGKHLSDMLLANSGLKKGDTLSPLLAKFAVTHAMRRVQINPEGLKVNGAHQVLVYADDVNITGQKHTDYNEKCGSFNSC